MGPKAPDIAAAAMTREAQTVMPVAAAQEQKMAARVAEQVRLKNSREAMKIPWGTLPDQHKSDQKAEQMGTKRKTDGTKDRNAAELGRVTAIKTADASARRFLTEGYDKLPGADKTKMREAVLKAARKSPLIAARLRNVGVTKASLDAFADGIIKEDPKFAAEVARNFDAWIASPDIADIVTPLQVKEAEATYKRDEAKIDFDDVSTQLVSTKQKLRDYQRPFGGRKGDRAQELDDLRKDAQTVVGEADALRKQEAEIADRLKYLKTNTVVTVAGGAAYPGGPPAGGRATAIPVDELRSTEGELKTVRENLAKAEAKVARLQFLEQEEARFNAERQRLEREQTTKQHELIMAEDALSTATGNRADAERLRESDEIDVVKGIEDVFLRAAEGTFDNETDMFLEAADDQVEAFAAQAKEANQKGIDKVLQQRYWKTEQRRKWLFGPKEDVPVVKRAEVNADYRMLMQQGPEAFMRQILKKSINPSSQPPVNYTDPEIEDLLKNKEYMEKARPEMLKYLMVQRMATSGITQEESRIITMSSWGDGLITSALEKSKEIRTNLEGLLEEGALSRHGFVDRIKEELRKNPALWLLLLTGAVAWPVGWVAGAVGAGALTATGIGATAGGLGIAGASGYVASRKSPEDESVLLAA